MPLLDTGLGTWMCVWSWEPLGMLTIVVVSVLWFCRGHFRDCKSIGQG